MTVPAVTLHRFFLPVDAFDADEVTFPPDIARQIRRVLRLRPGDRVMALDGSGGECTVRLDLVASAVRGTVEERRPNIAEPAAELALYAGTLKSARLEWVLQKGTELGVSRFVPIITARSVAHEGGENRRWRFDAVVREAAEQSRRGRIPSVSRPLSFQNALADAARGLAIILWEGERSIHLRDVPLDTNSGPIGLFVGPEGGFAEDEIALARAHGAHIATLGARILRAETASIAAATLLLARLGDLG